MKPTVEIIADSIAPNGKRITTLRSIYWLCIHPEHLRHGPISHSVASGRAIPISRTIEQVTDNPWYPSQYGKTHKGMQHSEVFTGDDVHELDKLWLETSRLMLEQVEKFNKIGVTKQLTNRLLAPWVQVRDVTTSTDYDAFLKLRLHDTAEIHIQELAVETLVALATSVPKKLEPGEWHLPFITDDDREYALYTFKEQEPESYTFPMEVEDAFARHNVSMADQLLILISAARCAYTSYDKNKGKTRDAELTTAARKLLPYHHYSPFEHQARARNVSKYYVSGRSRGWQQARKILEYTPEVTLLGKLSSYLHSILRKY